MELLVNDLSICGQFNDFSTFRDAIRRVMAIRKLARRFGRELYCHRNVAYAQVTKDLSMPQAIQYFSLNEKRAVMHWLTRQGPFWEDVRRHGPADYLKCNKEIVTDTAVGETAYCCFHGFNRQLISLIPSSWEFTPVPVTWVKNSGLSQAIEILNYWEPGEVEVALNTAPTPLGSWKQVETTATARYPNLTFSSDAFEGLLGHPFAKGAAQRILVLLDILKQYKCCLDTHGSRTQEGHRLYQDYFTGDNAWFSDSSDTEKHRFQTELTFRHPERNDESLFCTWHGKVKTPPIRIHFSWPIRANEPLYVVYVGPKITKR